jgi:hypothetical protein
VASTRRQQLAAVVMRVELDLVNDGGTEPVSTSAAL